MKNDLQGMMNKTFRYLLLMSLPALPLPAAAACVLCSCTATATGVAFGTYNPLSGPDLPATGNIHLSCTNGPLGGALAYSIALNQGLYSASFNPRQMDDAGGHRLNYNLYTSGTHATIWGDGTGGTGVVSGSVSIPFLLGGSGTADNTVYGLIPGGTQPTAYVGSYSDTITVTVTYN
jgi:spore coat protein U-like protein